MHWRAGPPARWAAVAEPRRGLPVAGRAESLTASLERRPDLQREDQRRKPDQALNIAGQAVGPYWTVL